MATTDLQIHTIMSSEDPEYTRDSSDLLWRRDIWSIWQYTSPASRESYLLMTHYSELKNHLETNLTYTIEWTEEDVVADSFHEPLVVRGCW